MSDTNKHNKLSIEKSVPERRGIKFTHAKKQCSFYLPIWALREKAPRLPELSELDIVRHYTNLSRLNYSLDTHFYPLGSCTMKYNPKAYEEIASASSFTNQHPFAPDNAVQGTLEFLFKTEKLLCELCAMDAFTLQPSAGAHGEWAGILITKAYHLKRKDLERTEIIVSDSSHGTNPASAKMGGFSILTVSTGNDGRIDTAKLEQQLSRKTALVMLTVPNTLGLFEKDIVKIASLVHKAGALLYMDGANFNALTGLVKPGNFGIDIMHLNLHKTFSTPHGGGGPGSGPVGVKKELEPFLPAPRIIYENNTYKLSKNYPDSIGMLCAFFGNVAVILKAYCYLRQHSAQDLRQIAENAIINANYLRTKLKPMYPCKFDEYCMHECVLSTDTAKMNGAKTIDVAKRLLDYGFYAPTIYFPLIVSEALMIEPAETESKEMLDEFIDAMTSIYKEGGNDSSVLKKAPHTLPVKRINEVDAARKPNLRWQ